MTNKDKFLALVSEDDPGTLEKNRERIRNRAMLRESQHIALKALLKLRDLGWTQIDLAKKMGVTPQQVSKVLSGKENLTIETQIKLQNILDIPVLASYYEKKAEKFEKMIVSFEERIDKLVTQTLFISNRYKSDSASYQQTYNYPFSIVA